MPKQKRRSPEFTTDQGACVVVRIPAPNDPDHDMLVAACAAIEGLPLFPEVSSSALGEFYEAVAELAEECHGEQMLRSKETLSHCDELLRTLSHPTRDKPLRAVRRIDPPSDVACDFYTPQIDAAYFIGVAIGLRLARLTGGAR